MTASPKGRKTVVAPLRRKASVKKKAPRAYHKGNVSRDLLAAASRILKTERVEDISVRRLAREVGVTPANFYNHFASLDELLLMLAAEGFDEIRINSEQILAEKKNRREALLQRSWMFVEFAIASGRFREASHASFGQLMYLIYGENIYDPKNLKNSHSKGRAAYAVFAMVYGLARNIIEEQFEFETGTRAEIRQFVEDAMSTLLDGTVATELASR
jgi:AcrR family transcriptional regulator